MKEAFEDKAADGLPGDPVKKARLQALLDLDNVSFLKEIVKLYPEAKLLAGPAIPSPERNDKLVPQALAYQVFDEATPVHETAVEADRTFTSLVLLRSALTNTVKGGEFPKLSDQGYEDLRKMNADIIRTADDLELMIYSLTAQDLGKTIKLLNDHDTHFTESARDHDHLLYEMNAEYPQYFPGFEALPGSSQASYLAGLDSDFNLGQFVQGENLPCNLQKIMQLDQHARDIRILTEIYDFMGAAGHAVPGKSILATDENLYAYRTAFDALALGDPLKSYAVYMHQRGARVGLAGSGDDILADKEKFALCRIAALSRAFTQDQGAQIRAVWDALPPADRATLTEEMAITGLNRDEKRGILVYYSPGLISNTIAAVKDFSKGLDLGLRAIANTYRAARVCTPETGYGQTTMDVNDLAKQAKTAPEKIVEPHKAAPAGPFKRLVLEM
ncbi:MAG TPA: hypothetical protein VL625_04800 [Patescibacteria group bacterium]|nr:hypothetical protein [Patescibacteria group bacterium]